MQRDTPAYSFERHQRRPVYVVQCFTTSVWLSIGGRLDRRQVRKAYRTAEDQAKRDETAATLRKMRLKGLHRDEVLRKHEMRLLEPSGIATPVNIAQELERFAGVVA
jgi:hypothetical protein